MSRTEFSYCSLMGTIASLQFLFTLGIARWTAATVSSRPMSSSVSCGVVAAQPAKHPAHSPARTARAHFGAGAFANHKKLRNHLDKSIVMNTVSSRFDDKEAGLQIQERCFAPGGAATLSRAIIGPT